MKNEIYLDNAATTKIKPEVYEIMLPYLKDSFGNPSSIYDLGVEAKEAIEQARKKVAGTLSVSPKTIFFTSGGTESNNWAIIGTAEQKAEIGKHIITTRIEHHAVLNACHFLENKGYEVTYLDVDEYGFVSLENLYQKIRKDTILVSVMAANNEIGTVQPWEKIANIVSKTNAAFHVDATQAYGQIPMSLADVPVDLMTASGHKFHGPKGVGFLYIKDYKNMRSFHYGGQQENGIRAGTENVASIVGMGEAAVLAQPKRERFNREVRLRNYMIQRILKEVPYSRLNGPMNQRLPGNVNISFMHTQGNMLVLLLDMDHICCSSGSACNSQSTKQSHVLSAIGLDEDLARGAIRFTLDDSITKEQIDYTIEKLKAAVEQLRKNSKEYQSFQQWNHKR